MIREDNWILLGYDKLLPYAEDYDIKELANLKPDPNSPDWSMWSFQPAHMDFIKKQKINHFELYDIQADVGQRNNVARENPEVVERLKMKMLHLKKEMINDGGDWFK